MAAFSKIMSFGKTRKSVNIRILVKKQSFCKESFRQNDKQQLFNLFVALKKVCVTKPLLFTNIHVFFSFR